MSAYLLDTHTFFWLINKQYSNELSNTVIDLFLNLDNQLYLSMASVWEIAIKVSIGKLDIKQPFAPFVSEQLRYNDIELLEIGFPHVMKIVELPFHHRDPFDRLIIAQSLVEQLPVLSRDKAFDAYDIQVIW